MSLPLPNSTPTDAGVDATGILNLIDALERDRAQEPHGLMILRHGAVIAQGWWAPYSADRPQLVYSLSKSFTSAAAGVLVDDGVLDLDSTVISHFPEFADDITDDRSRRMRVRHVASMATGHTDEMIDAAFGTDPAEPVRGLLLNPPEQEPGSVFAYNQPATYSLAAIVQRLTGHTLVEFLRERVLGPIGADEIAWQEWPAGRNLGYSGAFMTTDTIARLGQLLLRRGRWDQTRVLSERWVADATSVHVATAPEAEIGTSDWSFGYGFQHWRSRHGYRGDGAFGQLCLVLPEQDMVIAYQGQTHDMQGLLDAVWRHVLPAVDRGGSASADAALAARLAAATLPECTVTRVAVDAARWDGAVFAEAEDEPGAGAGAGADAGEGVDAGTGADAGKGVDAGVRAVGDRPGQTARLTRDDTGWVLTLAGATGGITARFMGDAGWTLTDEGGPIVAVSGGFAGDDELLLDIAFVETPHRLHLRFERGAGVVSRRWATAPLGKLGDLRGLSAPGAFG